MSGERTALSRIDASVPDVNNRLITLLIYFAFAVYGAEITAIGPLLLSMSETFRISLGEVGSIFVVGGIGFVLVVFLGGFLADRVGKRAIILIGMATMSLSLIGMGLSGSFLLLMGAFFVLNLGAGFLESAIGGLVVDLNPHRQTASLNVLHSFFGGGALVGPLVAGVILSGGGSWRLVFGVFGVALLAFLVVTAIPRFPNNVQGERVDWSKAGILLRSRVVQISMLGILIYVAAEMAISTWAHPYITNSFGSTAMVASISVSLFWAGIAIGRAGSVWLARLLRPERIVVLSALVFSVGAVILVISPNLTIALAAIFLAGLGAAPVYPTIMAIACSHFPGLSGTVTGLITTATGFGILIGPSTIGRIADASSFVVGILVCVAVMLLLVPLYFGRSDKNDGQS